MIPKKVAFLLVAVLLCSVLAVVFFKKSSALPATDLNTIPVVVSFYPLEAFTTAVGGEQVAVTTITPAGVEPHDFEPTPADIAKIYASKLFIFNGNGIDAWAEKIADDVAARGVTVLKMSEALALSPFSPQGNDKTPLSDPHFWLDPIYAEQEVEIIAQALRSIDPMHESDYTRNETTYRATLQQLDQQYRESLSQCQLHEIVTSHNAFAYLASRYNFSVLPLAGLSPEEEPSPQRIAELATLAKQKNIKHIFFETLVSPKLSQTLAREIGAQTLVFNPIEGLSQDDLAAGKGYSSIMRENLQNLKIALICQ